MSIQVHTYEFSVPRWEVVSHHPEANQRWAGDPPPDLTDACESAMRNGRLLVATFSDEEGEQHPYAVSGAVYPYYAHLDEPEGRSMDRVGKLIRTYGFHKNRPESLAVQYTYSPDGMDFEMVVAGNDQWRMLMKAGKVDHSLMIGEIGDDVLSYMIRTAVGVHILDALDGITRSGLLPYDKDTIRIAHARLGHVLSWQFETSRTKPLFA